MTLNDDDDNDSDDYRPSGQREFMPVPLFFALLHLVFSIQACFISHAFFHHVIVVVPSTFLTPWIQGLVQSKLYTYQRFKFF